MIKLGFDTSEGLTYPVGQHMERAIAFAKAAAEKFITIDEFKDRDIDVCCMGSSGSTLAALFINFVGRGRSVYITKPGEERHSRILPYQGNVIVMIDDLAVSGKTLLRMWDVMKVHVSHVDCLILEYGYNTYSFPFIPKYYIKRLPL